MCSFNIQKFVANVDVATAHIPDWYSAPKFKIYSTVLHKYLPTGRCHYLAILNCVATADMQPNDESLKVTQRVESS